MLSAPDSNSFIFVQNMTEKYKDSHMCGGNTKFFFYSSENIVLISTSQCNANTSVSRLTYRNPINFVENKLELER